MGVLDRRDLDGSLAKYRSRHRNRQWDRPGLSRSSPRSILVLSGLVLP